MKDPISTGTIRDFYDRMAPSYDLFSTFEARAKERALQLLQLAPGQSVLNAGAGTGKEHQIIQRAVSPGGHAAGIDLAPGMLAVTRRRTGAPLAQADIRDLPFAAQSFDRLFSTYVLDLIPSADLPALLRGFRRVLRPGGRMVLVSLTEGVNLPSRAFVALWKLAYRIQPLSCGGCRPLELTNLVEEAGFAEVQRDTVTQMGVPSEVLLGIR